MCNAKAITCEKLDKMNFVVGRWFRRDIMSIMPTLVMVGETFPQRVIVMNR